MKHRDYARIFKSLRTQLLTFVLVGLMLLILRQIFTTIWLVFAFFGCVLYCSLLFIGLILIWILDRKS